jgi:hypothetical protein
MRFKELSKIDNITPEEAKTGNDIKIPEGKFAVWDRIGSLNTNAGQLEFFSGQSDKYHLDLSFTNNSDLKVPIIESKINFNNETNHHEFIFSYPDKELFESLENQEGFNQIYDNYVQTLINKEQTFLNTLDRESHVHKIYNHNFNINNKERDIELIHQTRGGDCVLANLINTTSFESNEGSISFTIKEARDLAIRLRNQRGVNTSDIISPDSALMSEDAFYLFYNKLGSRSPRQNDYMSIDGNLPENQLHKKVINILERLTECSRNLCSVGMQIHSISIKWIPNGIPEEYIVIDPMNPNGLKFLNTDEIIDFIKVRVRGNTENNNFFCFID